MSNKTKKKKIDKEYKVKDKEINNDLESMILIRLSPQAIEYLNKIVKLGIFGRSVEEVVGRFIDDKLLDFVDIENIDVKL